MTKIAIRMMTRFRFSAKKSAASDRGPRKRSGDLGRALRSVYDDTLREAVPDDFLNLLGKLT